MGRPWPAPGEPLFTEQDTEEALALQQLDDESCPGCGQPIVDAYDPANERRYDVHKPICFACRARERASHAAHRSETEGVADGMKFVPYLDDDD